MQGDDNLRKALRIEHAFTPDDMRRILSYDPESGLLRWKRNDAYNKTWNTKYEGTLALNFKQPDGYMVGSINKIKAYSHRIAWAIYYGEWPDGEIDHINRNRCDNRIENLRVATRSQNTSNKTKKDGTYSRLKGVTWHSRGKRWMAQIMKDRVKIYLGSFDTEEAAHEAYKEASLRLHGEFSST